MTALHTIVNSGRPGGTIVAKRDDDHICAWCRGWSTPCPVAAAQKALDMYAAIRGSAGDVKR